VFVSAIVVPAYLVWVGMIRLPSSSIIVRFLAQKHKMPVLSICDNKANAAFSIWIIISTGQRERLKK